MNIIYSKIIIIIAFATSISTLIVGVILQINGMIIGGVVGLFASAVLTISILINNSTKINTIQKENINHITNPLSIV